MTVEMPRKKSIPNMLGGCIVRGLMDGSGEAVLC